MEIERCVETSDYVSAFGADAELRAYSRLR